MADPNPLVRARWPSLLGGRPPGHWRVTARKLQGGEEVQGRGTAAAARGTPWGWGKAPSLNSASSMWPTELRVGESAGVWDPDTCRWVQGGAEEKECPARPRQKREKVRNSVGGRASGRGDSERRRKGEIREVGDMISLGETVGGFHRWRKCGCIGWHVTELRD